MNLGGSIPFVLNLQLLPLEPEDSASAEETPVQLQPCNITCTEGTQCGYTG